MTMSCGISAQPWLEDWEICNLDCSTRTPVSQEEWELVPAAFPRVAAEQRVRIPEQRRHSWC